MFVVACSKCSLLSWLFCHGAKNIANLYSPLYELFEENNKIGQLIEYDL